MEGPGPDGASKPSSDGDDDLRQIADEVNRVNISLQRSKEQLKTFSSLASRPLATSSPLSQSFDIQNLKALMPADDDRRPYARRSEVFLKPLPATRYYGRSILSSRHNSWFQPNQYEGFHQPFALCPFSQLYRARSEPSSVGQETATYHTAYPSSESEKEETIGILKKKSGATPISVPPIDGAKEIKIIQSGGVLILQNYKDLPEGSERKGFSEISSKLIEDCQKLSEGLKEEVKEKTVQFDFSSAVTSSAQSPVKDSSYLDSSFRSKEPSSLSTNESMLWQPMGMASPSGSTSARRLEWDSGADVGYLNMDIAQDGLSTIERLTIQGLKNQGKKEKRVVYKTSRGDRVLERIPSDLVELEEQRHVVLKDTGTNPDTDITNDKTLKDSEETMEPETSTSAKSKDETKKSPVFSSSSSSNNERHKTNEQIQNQSKNRENKHKNKKSGKETKVNNENATQTSLKDKLSSEDSPPQTRDQSTLVNTLGEEFGFYKLPSSESDKIVEQHSPREKRLVKKKGKNVSARTRKIQQILAIARSMETAENEQVQHFVESVEEIVMLKPVSPPSSSGPIPDKSSPESVSIAIQVEEKSMRKSCKSVQASGELNSLPRHLESHKLIDPSGREVRTKSTQYFGESGKSLPRELTHMDRIKKHDSHKKEKTPPKHTKSTKEVMPLTKETLESRKDKIDSKIIQDIYFDSQRKEMEDDKSKLKSSSKAVKAKSSVDSVIKAKSVPVAGKELVAVRSEESAPTTVEQGTSMDVKELISASTSMTRTESRNEDEKKKELVSASTSMERPAQFVEQGTSMTLIESPAQLVSASTSMTRIEEEKKNQVKSASTSMERAPQLVEQGTSMSVEPSKNKTVSASVGVQYSPRELFPDKKSDETWMENTRNDSNDRKEWTDTLDSKASSTQTAHSWIHGGAPVPPSVVKPTRSFEYVPGDIYESSSNLREKIPSETSVNVISGSNSSAESEMSCNPEESSVVMADNYETKENVFNNTGGTLVLEDTHRSLPGAWLLVPNAASDAVQIICSKFAVPEEKRNVSDNTRNSTSSSSNVDLTASKGSPSKSAARMERRKKKVVVEETTSNSEEASIASKHSACVQTEPYVELSRRNPDLLRMLRAFEQLLLSEGYRRTGTASEILSLDRKSQMSVKGGRSSTAEDGSIDSNLVTSVSLSTSPRKIKKSKALTPQELSESSYRPIQLRASSTPVPSSSNGVQSSVKASSGEDTSNLESMERQNLTTSKLRKKDHREKSAVRHQISVDNETQSEVAPTQNQSTQMSSRKYEGKDSETQMSNRMAGKDTETQVGSSLRVCCNCSRLKCCCGKSPPPRQVVSDEATQMTIRICIKCGSSSSCGCSKYADSVDGRKKSSEPNGHGCSKCRKSPCSCSSSTEKSNKCLKCCKQPCCCKASSSSSSSARQLKIDGFSDVDFSSGVPNSTTSRSEEGNKENVALCSVCRCCKGKEQACVFCVCHIDKKSHIPKCDCHSKIPRYLIPGFCKCHQRNIRHFNNCRCVEEDDIKDNKCPCCEHFKGRIRANIIAAQLEGVNLPVKRQERVPSKNYFLKLEETEVSKESSDVSEPDRRPVEVVTIKIPVKKMGRARVPTKEFYYEADVKQVSTGSTRNNGLKSSSNRSSKNGHRSREEDIEFLDDIVRKYSSMLSSKRSTENGKVKEYVRPDSRTTTSYRTLQECLESNRPDFFNSAESRRRIIQERAKDREARYKLTEPKKAPLEPQPPKQFPSEMPKRIFTTAEIREQTRKRCKHLSEVTEKKEDRKRREKYKTNKLMAEIFAKRLQLKTLKGQLNISNSCDLLAS